MEIFLLTFFITAMAVVGMGVGVLFGKTPIKGSCGGSDTLSLLGFDCTGCEKPCDPDEREICHISREQTDISTTCPIIPVSSQR